MQKTSTVITASATAAGVILALLRIIHTKMCMADGVPKEGIVTFLLSAAAFAAIVVSFIIAYIYGKGKIAEKEVSKSMATHRGGFYLIFQLLAAVLVAIHGFISYPQFPEIIKNHNAMALPLALIFSVSHIIISVLIYKGKTSKVSCYLGIVAPLYFCLQLGEIFYANITNPVLLQYSYECLTFGCFALYLLSMAGNASGKDQVFNIIFSGVLALICAPAALTGPQLTSERILLYIAVLLTLLPNLPIYFSNLIKREKKQKEKKDAQE